MNLQEIDQHEKQLLLKKTDDDNAVEKLEIILNDATRKTSSENTIIQYIISIWLMTEIK